MFSLRMLLGFLFFLPKCVLSQISLLESGPRVLQPSQTFSGTCKVSGASLTDSRNMYGVGWVRQPPGKGLEWLAGIYYNNDIYYSQTLKSRLTISRDVAKSEVYLQITTMKTEDTGRYYCARGGSKYIGSSFDVWGKGLQVTITAGQPSKPSVFPLVSCCGAKSSTNVAMGCLVTGYLPEPVTVSWDQNGAITSGVKTFPSVLHRGSSHYSLSSVLSVSSADWETKNYKCLVKHEPTNTNEDKAVSSAECKVATSKPVVQVLQSPCDDRDGNGSIELVCLVSGYSPDKIRVRWLLNGEPTFIPVYTSPSLKGSNGTFTTTSQVKISKSEWTLGERYTCEVDHPATNSSLHRSIRDCPESSSGSPLKVSLIPPKAKDLYISKQPSIVCRVTKMESADGLSITWEQADGSPVDVRNDEPEEQSDGFYGADSTLTITTDAWNRRTAFTCKVEHPDLTSPITKFIQKPQEEPELAPSMYLFPPHEEELKQHNLVSLTCLLKGFSPADVYVQWKHQNSILPDNASLHTAAVQEKGTNGPDTYFIYSMLTIPKSKWESREGYSCVAVHSGLPGYRMQRSIQKTRGK